MGTRWGWLAIAGIAALATWAVQRDAGSSRAEPASSAFRTSGGARAQRAASLELPGVIDSRPRPLRLTAADLRAALRDGAWTLGTPAGGRFVVRELRERDEERGMWSVTGRVETAAGPQSMVLTVGPGAIFGVVPRPDGQQLHVTTTRGVVSVALAGDLVPPRGRAARDDDFAIPPTAQPRTPGNETPPMAASQPAADTVGPTRIDVLGLYTDDLVELRGSVAAAETEVTNLFAISHQAHVDSGTGIVVQVVGLRRVPSDPAKTNRTILEDITYNRIGGIDLVALRNALSADLVALVRPSYPTNASCGIAWLSGSGMSPGSSTPAFGFSVNNVSPCSPYVLAHELGHNMGSMHDLETSTTNGAVTYGAYAFSFGYRQSASPAFATIMAYTQAGQPRVGYFSSPESSRCGAACGVVDKADNVRSLKLMGSRIAAFRGPPGTLSIIDTDGFEPDPGLWSAQPRVTVRLSGAAPAGGVSFSVAIAGGTAIAGVDYEVPAQSTYTIPAGQSETSLGFSLLGDTVEEPDETIEIRLTNVVGATLDDAAARLTIRNEDPRVQVTGRVRFPAGMAPPASAFPLRVTGLNGDGMEQAVVLSPPEFAYQLSAVPRATLSLHAQPGAPYVDMPARLEDLRTSRTFDHVVEKGLKVSGRLRAPAGESMPASSLWLDASATLGGARQPLPYLEVSPPDFRYEFWVVPGTWVHVRATPPAPYTPFVAVRTRVLADWEQEAPLSRLPGVIVWSPPMLDEGAAGTTGSASAVVELSTPAPAGGARMRYTTVDRTATAGSDYVAASGVIEFAAGERTKDVPIAWSGDDRVEGDEHFQISLSEIEGAQPVTTETTVWLDEPDPIMSRPLPPEPVP